MNCSCAIDVSCGESYASFYTSTIRKAIKEHICSECKSIIPKGSEYEYARGKWEGCFYALKTCSDCLSLRKSFCSNGFMHESIREDIEVFIVEDMEGEVPEKCIASLTPAARAFACEAIEKTWEENEGMNGR